MSGTCAVDPRPTIEKPESVDGPRTRPPEAEASASTPVLPDEATAEALDDLEEPEPRE